MADQHQQKPAKTDRQEPATSESKAAPADSKLSDELDDILDEIDEVLETNAEEFVKSYVQKGGE